MSGFFFIDSNQGLLFLNVEFNKIRVQSSKNRKWYFDASS